MFRYCNSNIFEFVVRNTTLPVGGPAPKIAAGAAAIVMLLAGPFAGKAFAHDAPSGWHYPIACCSGYDCRAVPKKAISERPEGYVITTTGEVVAYSDKRIRTSEDSDYHWCSRGGLDTGETICLFVPPNLF